MKKNTLNKEERLKSRKAIEQLFRSGKTISSPPFRVLYRFVEQGDATSKMTVAIPKRMIKHAADRNLLKRRTREVYRVQKHDLNAILQKKNLQIELLFLYQASEILDFAVIKRSVSFLLKKLETYTSKR